MKNFKKVISTVIALAISASSLVAVSASSFSDVADTASYAEAIEVLSALGIVNGYVEDGVTSFKPEGEITRAEAATMIVGALNMTDDAKNSAGTCQFADVNKDASWAAGYVNVGVSEGFIAGRNENEFDPQSNVTYAEMCVMLTKITGYAEYAESSKKEGEPWYKCYTDMAASIGLNRGASVPLTSALTRGTVAQMIYNAITTPVLGVDVYAFKGNEYKPQDEKDNFKTVLSDKFDGYVLTVRISQTAKADNLENDKAYFKAVKADYWAGEVKEDIIKTRQYPVILKNGVDVSDYKNQTGKAVILINEYDENEMIYFKADARLEKKIVSPEDYVRQGERRLSFTGSPTGDKTIAFGTTEVKVTDNVELYVNGTEYKNPVVFPVDADGDGVQDTDPTTGAPLTVTRNVLTDAMFDKFLGNAQGDITFVKSDENLNRFDSIFVNYYEIGRVASVSYKNEKTTVRLTPIVDCTTAGAPALSGAIEIVIDDENVEEGETVVTVKKNGVDVELKELVKDDIIAFATNFSSAYTAPGTRFPNPKFIDVLASDEAIKGMVVDYDDEVGTFTVGENEYKYVGFDYATPTGTATLEITHTYDLVLDAFGRIADKKKVATTDKFAILEKYNAGTGVVALVLADGSRATYDLASGTENTFTYGDQDALSGAAIATLLTTYVPAKTNIQNRIVKYRVSGDEVKIFAPDTAPQYLEGKYNPSLGKVGAVKIADGVNFINAKTYAGNASEYAKFDTSDFVAQTEYKFYACRVNTFYSFVVFTDIGVTFTEDSRFAVLLENVGSKMTPDGEPVYGAKALYNGEETVLYWENNKSINQGEAIFFTTDADGFVNREWVVYAKNPSTHVFTNRIPAFASALTAGVDYTTGDWAFNTFNSSAADIRLVHGIVTDVTSDSITFGVADSNNEIDYKNVEVDINPSATPAVNSGLFTYGIASGCQAYEYNSGADGRESGKYAITEAAAIVESVPYEKVGSPDVYVFDSTVPVTEAIALVVNGDVVCIYANF